MMVMMLLRMIRIALSIDNVLTVHLIIDLIVVVVVVVLIFISFRILGRITAVAIFPIAFIVAVMWTEISIDIDVSAETTRVETNVSPWIRDLNSVSIHNDLLSTMITYFHPVAAHLYDLISILDDHPTVSKRNRTTEAIHFSWIINLSSFYKSKFNWETQICKMWMNIER